MIPQEQGIYIILPPNYMTKELERHLVNLNIKIITNNKKTKKTVKN